MPFRSAAQIFSGKESRSGSIESEMPPYEIVVGGRSCVNPEYARIRDILKLADWRIRKAVNPRAYARAIIRRERVAVKKPPQREEDMGHPAILEPREIKVGAALSRTTVELRKLENVDRLGATLEIRANSKDPIRIKGTKKRTPEEHEAEVKRLAQAIGMAL